MRLDTATGSMAADQYATLTTDLNNIRQQKTDLLTGADLPLPGLSVVDGELTYLGKKWDGKRICPVCIAALNGRAKRTA